MADHSHLRMEFRYLVCAPSLNAHGTLHGGVLMRWIDEACGMHSRKLANRVCVTRYMDKIDFESCARAGDIVRIECVLEECGSTSLSYRIRAREDICGRVIATVGRVVFVAIDNQVILLSTVLP